MSFQSNGFFVFLGVTLAAVLLLSRRSRETGKILLAAASLVFYVAGGGFRGLAMLVLGLFVSRWALTVMEGQETAAERKRPALLAAAYHIAVLLVFKYTGFFTGGAVSIGWVPLGLSFFTFQQLWLLKEAQAGKAMPRTPGDLLLYGLFFPTVTSGPILKPENFFPQLEEGRFLHPTWQDAAAGLYAIVLGTMKKVLLADHFGIVVNHGWEQLDALSAPAAWVVILGYTFQLYFDFSGYCDIATGLARLFGLRLPQNFNSPYRSLSVGEFWKRWHITLTSFLRECLYFPLGGSRKGSGRTYLNILIVFLVSGFWHGAGWTFLVWGGLHGLAQITERALGARRERLPKWFRWGLTFLFVNLAWIFFRAPTLTAALDLIRAALTGGLALPSAWLVEGLFAKEAAAVQILFPALKPWINPLLLGGLFGAGTLAAAMPRNTIQRMEEFRPTVWRAALLALGMTWSVLSFSGISTFIYSNF